MDVREAIKRIKKMRKERNTVLCSLPKGARKRSDYNNDVLAFTTAIEALEKQLPKKIVDRNLVKDNGIVVGFIGKCPGCGDIIDDSNVVCDCGQKLDWRVEENERT